MSTCDRGAVVVRSQEASPLYVTAPPASPHDASRREIARSAVAGLGGSALTRALERWRRVLVQDRPPGGSAAGASAAGASGGHAADPDALAMLARRLDDSGCSYGRVSAARLEQVIRAYDRLETKINAVLMAVTGTFLSTLAGLLLYYARGGGQ